MCCLDGTVEEERCIRSRHLPVWQQASAFSAARDIDLESLLQPLNCLHLANHLTRQLRLEMAKKGQRNGRYD